MKKGFYQAFQDKHRGSRDLIKSRLQVYIPFIEIFKSIEPKPYALDLGCGRGEWLEVLNNLGFQTHGVDVDEEGIQFCTDIGLSVSRMDFLDYLKNVPDQSVAVISGFHIAEHILFEQLQLLISEALRALKPCGLLILETPNPENIAVGTNNFYLDPTHKHPLPSGLLVFLTEYYGYHRAKILGLQENSELVDSKPIRLMDVISGVSPDYAIIAQKNGESHQLNKMDSIFTHVCGLDLRSLANRYDQKIIDIKSMGQENQAEMQKLNNAVQKFNLYIEPQLEHIKSQTTQLEEQIKQEKTQFSQFKGQFLQFSLYIEPQIKHIEKQTSQLEEHIKHEKMQLSQFKGQFLQLSSQIEPQIKHIENQTSQLEDQFIEQFDQLRLHIDAQIEHTKKHTTQLKEHFKEEKAQLFQIKEQFHHLYLYMNSQIKHLKKQTNQLKGQFVEEKMEFAKFKEQFLQLNLYINDQIDPLKRQTGQLEEQLEYEKNQWPLFREQLQQIKFDISVINERNFSLQEKLNEKIRTENQELHTVKNVLTEVQRQRDYWHFTAENAQQQVVKYENSKSWKITLPLRLLRKNLNIFSQLTSSLGMKITKKHAKNNLNNMSPSMIAPSYPGESFDIEKYVNRILSEVERNTKNE